MRAKIVWLPSPVSKVMQPPRAIEVRAVTWAEWDAAVAERDVADRGSWWRARKAVWASTTGQGNRHRPGPAGEQFTPLSFRSST
jgi:hypothetical protein